MVWNQPSDPLHNVVASTVVAALPVVTLLGAIAVFKWRAHTAALLGLGVAFLVSVIAVDMPVSLAVRAALLGAAYGLLPIGWIILNVIFLYRLAHKRGLLDILQRNLSAVSRDRRLQLVLVAFCLGAFFEGAAGFGTPVAITGALLIGLGFSPLEASGLSLIANTAPVAFGALGTPLVALQGVTGLDLRDLSAMVGRQLPLFSLIVPAWIAVAYAGVRRGLAIWPALLTVGVTFAVVQALLANLHGPWLVDVGASIVSIAALLALLRVWQPGDIEDAGEQGGVLPPDERRATAMAWMPWLVLSVVVFAWGLPEVRGWLDGLSHPTFPVPGLHLEVVRQPPVVATAKPEPAVFVFNWLSATGSGILVAAVIAGLALGYTPAALLSEYGATLVAVRLSLLTIAAMLALGFLSRYAGLDAILGLAFARTGPLYPFFGTLLGWLGVALTGSDTSSNVLFGSLQRITAEHVGVSPVLMAAANSSGGVMGKMIDAQSIVVASTVTRWYGQEWAILRFVFLHSIVLAVLVGVLVTLQAYAAPFTHLVVR